MAEAINAIRLKMYLFHLSLNFKDIVKIAFIQRTILKEGRFMTIYLNLVPK